MSASKCGFQLAVIMLVIALAVKSQAQSPVAYVFAGTPNGPIGNSVSAAGDVNADGYADVLVGAPDTDSSLPGTGTVYVYSGYDGSPLFVIHGTHWGQALGFAVSNAGDTNNDGFDDFIATSFSLSSTSQFQGIQVYSGLDGSILHSFSSNATWYVGSRFTRGGFDIDGDGVPDILAYSYNLQTSTAGIRAFSGADGSAIRHFVISEQSWWSRMSLDGIDDIDADGFDDILLGMPVASPGNMNGAGAVRVLSGATGALIYEILGDTTGDEFGSSVRQVGDINNDGITDFMAAAPYDDSVAYSSGRADVYSGADGVLLHRTYGSSQLSFYGSAICGAGDVNQDGFDDFVVGADLEPSPTYNQGRATVYSGFDGHALYVLQGVQSYDGFSRSMDNAGDVNGDGLDDLIVGIPLSTPAGYAAVFVGPTSPAHEYASLAISPTLQLSWAQANPYDSTGTLSCTGATPGARGFYAMSLHAEDSSVHPFAALLISTAANDLLSYGGFSFDLQGQFILPGANRQSPYIPGTHVYIQFFETYPVPSSSNGLRLLLSS